MRALDIVVDTSVVIAVLLNEPSKAGIVAATTGCSLIGPAVIPWEVGNALSAMFKKKRIGLALAQKALTAFEDVPIRYVDVDMSRSLRMAYDFRIYAYDAYFLDCARRHTAPLISLDDTLVAVARGMGIDVREVAR
jgi:predicted nucleic acid-binding protein